MKKLFVHLSVGLLALSATPLATAATIAWSATPASGYGFDRASGVDLPVGSLVRVGTFNISDSVIQQNAANIAFLNTNFVEAGSITIGTGVGGNPGFFTASSTYDATATGLAGKQVYFWVFASTNNSTKTTSINTATEIGIFYEPNGSNSSWIFPSDTPTPGSTTVAMADLVGASDAVRPEAKTVVGTYGPGTSTLTGKPSFTLSAVPEPGSAALALIGGMIVASRRRRR